MRADRHNTVYDSKLDIFERWTGVLAGGLECNRRANSRLFYVIEAKFALWLTPKLLRLMPTLNVLSMKAAGRHAMRSSYTWGRQHLATPPHLCVYPGKSILACGYLWVARGGGIDSLQAYKAGWNWCNPRGGAGQSWGKENPPIGLETKLGQRVCNTAALLCHSVTSSALCPKGIQIHLVLENREQTKACSFTLE